MIDKTASRKGAKALSFTKSRNKLFPPPPNLPHQGGGVIYSLPWWEGLKEGDKMVFTYLLALVPIFLLRHVKTNHRPPEPLHAHHAHWCDRGQVIGHPDAHL